MKKKISLLLCLIFTVLTMSACGADPTTVDYYGTSYSDLQTVAEVNVEILAAATAEELETIALSITDKPTLKMVKGWIETTAGLGEYQGLDKLVVAKANGTVTVDQYVNYVGRQVVVSFVWDYDYAEEELGVTDISVDLVYTLGEKMEKAALNTLMGMGTVFTVLILISLIIYCFRFIGDLQNLGKKKQPAEVVETKTEEVPQEAVLTDDLELVAVISAAIAASEGTTVDGFVVRSIHRR